MTEIPLIQRAAQHADAIAFADGDCRFSYQQLLNRSAAIATALLGSQHDLNEARVAVLAPAGPDYASAQWAVWRSGGIMVPLGLTATEPEWEQTLADADASTVLADASLADQVAAVCRRAGINLQLIDQAASTAASDPLPPIDPARRAMILYTSGTTSRPKGVVTTHANITAQIESLVDAWRWQAADRIPLFLPLHHIHGIINVMSCALWSGATIEASTKLDLDRLLDRVADRAYTLLMAVPTIYVKLIAALDAMPDDQRDKVIDGFAQMRLMVSGSAALPASVHRRWLELTGQQLLERYGMTEIGMALGNPYDGQRRAGSVGGPLPGVEVRLKSECGAVISEENVAGEIQVRGPTVFREYWNRPEATAAAFDDNWFRTGDVALIQSGYYHILGRQSIDIIKSGGYKLSALEIEAALLDHPSITQCAVIGVEDATWGEAVAAAVVLQPGESVQLEPLRQWCRQRLSSYKIPRRLLVLDQLPRNAMGKVTKPALRQQFASDQC